MEYCEEKKYKIKLIISDIDGTLLNNAGRIDNDTRETLLSFQRQGGILALATARHLHECKDIIRVLFADYSGYIISSNGVYIHDTLYNYIDSFGFLNVEDVTEIQKRLPKTDLTIVTDGMDYCCCQKNKWNTYAKKIIRNIVSNGAQKTIFTKLEVLKRINPKIEKIIIHGDSVENSVRYSEVQKIYRLTFSSAGNIEVFSMLTEKSIAARYWADLLTLNDSEIAVFGDDINA